MAGELKGAFGDSKLDVELVKGPRSSFEVSVNGELVYSRLQTGRFPEPEAITELVKAKV